MTSLDYYGIEELLTDDERAARDRTRRFVQEEVMPEIVPCHRAGKFPEHLRPRMGALRLFAPFLKEHGCAGLSYTAYGLIMQELERADSGLRSEASVQGALAARSGVRRTRRLFRADGTRARLRPRWYGNPSKTRRGSLCFERQQVLD